MCSVFVYLQNQLAFQTILVLDTLTPATTPLAITENTGAVQNSKK